MASREVKSVSHAKGNADNSEEGTTITVEYDNGDIISIEILPDCDEVWVQPLTWDGEALMPGDGEKVKLWWTV